MVKSSMQKCYNESSIALMQASVNISASISAGVGLVQINVMLSTLPSSSRNIRENNDVILSSAVEHVLKDNRGVACGQDHIWVACSFSIPYPVHTLYCRAVTISSTGYSAKSDPSNIVNS